MELEKNERHERVMRTATPEVIHVQVDIELAREREGADEPSIIACRHAVLTIQHQYTDGEKCLGYVVYDRLLNRIVDGVYAEMHAALDVAHGMNQEERRGVYGLFRAPNGVALNLQYPGKRK